MNRGFYLRDGGYYFAISDRMDLKVLGEILQRAHGDFPRSPIIIKDTDIVVISMPVIW